MKFKIGLLGLWVGALAFAEMRADFNFMPGPPATTAEYRSSIFGAKNIPSQNLRVRQLSSDFAFSTPVFKGDRDTVALRTALSLVSLDSSANINGQALPAVLWSVGVGANYQRKIADREVFSTDILLGSASDKPFHSINESALIATFSYSIPQGATDSWLFLVNYSNLRPALNHIPIPGAAYLYQPSPEVRAIFGLPFTAIFWTPKPWFLTGLASPFGAQAQVAYAVWGPLQVFTGFAWNTQTFFQWERSDKDERFFHALKTLSFGVRSPVSRTLMLELSTAYTFDRSYYQGYSYTKVRGDSVNVEAGFNFFAQFRLRI